MGQKLGVPVPSEGKFLSRLSHIWVWFSCVFRWLYMTISSHRCLCFFAITNSLKPIEPNPKSSRFLPSLPSHPPPPLLPSLYDTGFNPFLNLPREAIESLWLSYNLIGEGWALQVEDLQAIVGNASYLADKLGITAEHGTCPITSLSLLMIIIFIFHDSTLISFVMMSLLLTHSLFHSSLVFCNLPYIQ